MSLDEYNRHSILGPVAGPATTVSAIAGQAAYEQAHGQPAVASGSNEPLTITGTMRTLAALVVAGAAGTAGAFLLPETPATIAGFIALMSGIGIVIVSIFAGTEAVKFAIGWTFSSAIEHRWWWVVAAALAAFVFAAFHEYAFGPFDAWMVALFAAALALAGRFVPALRPASAALGAGVVAYILTASHIFEQHSFLALLIAAATAAVIFGVGYAAQASRRRKSAL